MLAGVSTDAVGEFQCEHCGATGRYEGEELTALFIPNYYLRIAELEKLNRELVNEIDLEGIKGEYRDMRWLQKKHNERQNVLAEYSFLSYFRQFVEKW